MIFLPLAIRGQVVEPRPIQADSSLIDDLTPDEREALARADSARIEGDTLRLSPAAGRSQQQILDSLKASSDLKPKVDYSARDSIVFMVGENMLYLYNQSKLSYEKTKLEAAEVRINWGIQTMYANGLRDSTGELRDTPIFQEGEGTYEAQEMTYNFKSQKGRIINGRTQEGDGYLHGRVVKRMPDGTFNSQGGKYTTCDLPDPHFWIQASKLKVLNDDKIVSGPLNLVIEGFPIPIVIPFGFFPNKQGQQSRIQLPQYGEAADRGFFLRELGYYMGINEYMDVLFSGDIYTRGGWRAGARLTYNKRYYYRGSFNFEYGVQKFGERTDPNFSRTAAWRLAWSHSQPINPSTNLSSSVNLSSSSSFQRDISYNANDFFTNNLNSSISFQKRFPNTPFSMSATASHRQDLNKGTMSMDLPTINVTMARQTPFKNLSRKSSMDWLTQLGVNYNVQAQNRLNTIPDSLFLDILLRPGDSVDIKRVVGLDTLIERKANSSFYKNGIRHTGAASTVVKMLKYVNLTPSFNFTEYWYFESLRQVWNDEAQKVDDVIVPGFTTARDFNTSVSASTNFYGIYQFKGKRQIAIRQRVSPSVSYNLNPDFSLPRWGYYDSVQVNAAGRKQLYNRFRDGVYGSPRAGESQAIGFSLTNVMEMKYRKKESFNEDFGEKEDPFERVRILDNLGLSTSYNFAADSFQLSPFRLSARTQLLNGKINLNSSATLDPYALNAEGRRIKDYLVSTGDGLARLTDAQISISTRLTSKKKGEKNRSTGFNQEEYDQIQRQIYQYVDFDIPWTASLNYNFNYRKSGLQKSDVTQTIRAQGDFNFTPKWKIGLTTGFDVTRREVTNTQVNVYRDLHCWEMSFNWIPFGRLKSYTLSINVRSATLRDLRLNKRNQWQDRVR